MVLALTFLLYAQTLTFEFVYDDIPLVEQNQKLRHLSNIPSMLLEEDILDGVHAGYYRPLVPVVDTLVFQAAGARAWAYHLANVATHLLAVALVYFLALRLLAGHALGAAVAALFFGLHPANVEAVAFITGKNNIQCAVFALGCALAFLKYREAGGWKWLWASVGLFTLALGFKEFALMTPFVLACHEYISDRPGARRWWGSYVPFVVAASAFLSVRAYVLKGAVGAAVDVQGLVQRALYMPELAARYVKLTLLPVGLRALYDIRLVPSAVTVIAAIALAVALYFAWRLRQHRWVVFGVLWFFAHLAPVMNLVPVSGSAMAERYAYVSMAGAALLAGGLYAQCSGSRFARWAALGLLAALAVMSFMHARHWRSDEALYSHMSLTTPSSYKGHYNLGNMRFRQGRSEEAKALWEKAIAVKPDLYAVHNNLGVLYEKSGQYALAEAHYRAVLGVRSMTEVSMNLANVLARQGKYEEATDMLLHEVRVDSRNVQAYLRLAELREQRGDLAGALAALQEAGANVPGDYRPHSLAGAMLGAAGRYGPARASFERALKLNPACTECAHNLKLLETLGR